MFLRTVKAAGGKGVQHEYVRLVESYRDHGQSKQRVVCNLGRKDLLAAHLDALIRLLRGERGGGQALRAGDVHATGAWDWGPLLVARTLWQELGLDTILDRLGGRGAPGRGALAERALVLAADRLCEPTSEHGLAGGEGREGDVAGGRGTLSTMSTCGRGLRCGICGVVLVSRHAPRHGPRRARGAAL